MSSAGTSRSRPYDRAVADQRAVEQAQRLDDHACGAIGLEREFGARHGIDVYLQPGGPGTVAPLGEARTLCYRLEAFGLTLSFLPTDFVQVNAAINTELVATAVRYAALEPKDRVLDLYCGLGNFSLPLAQRAGELLGVEGEEIGRASCRERV